MPVSLKLSVSILRIIGLCQLTCDDETQNHANLVVITFSLKLDSKIKL